MKEEPKIGVITEFFFDLMQMDLTLSIKTKMVGAFLGTEKEITKQFQAYEKRYNKITTKYRGYDGKNYPRLELKFVEMLPKGGPKCPK